jgi:hypothetical protein
MVRCVNPVDWLYFTFLKERVLSVCAIFGSNCSIFNNH